MQKLRYIIRIIIGLVFIFSGIVKAIDPLGSAYKFHDYFMAFNLGFLDWATLPLSIILSAAEFIAGFAVLTGLRQKSGLWLVMIFMIGFTPLTLILALTNPVSDCGCFGDAIHLTNWQTFWKNIIIITLAIILFIRRKNIKQLFKSSIEWIITAVVIFFFILFSLGNLKYLPIIDFLPYKTGVKIADKMIIPEGVAGDEYLTTFIYEKEGIKEEFDLNNYPASDTSWIFVEQKSTLIKEGYQPPIHDFSLTTRNGEDITQKVLSYPGYSLFMIAKKLEEIDNNRLIKGFDLGNLCNEQGIDFYILSASGSDQIMSIDNVHTLCSVDEITLKTILRANPGYLLLKDGIIIGKWSWFTVPDSDWFRNINNDDEAKTDYSNRGIFVVFTIVLAFSCVLLILWLLVRKK
jgi:uncharacterized membrane protein YphA (DoxX/SURF4 family)